MFLFQRTPNTPECAIFQGGLIRRKSMHPIRKKAQPVAILMTILTLMLSVPYQSAVAALVGTESMLNTSRSQQARETLKQFMAREDVRSAIVAQGVAPAEADARLNSLTDAEVIQLADQINHLPAGGDVLGLAIVVLVIVILVLVIIRLL
jgi:predicted transcriptional regulator